MWKGVQWVFFLKTFSGVFWWIFSGEGEWVRIQVFRWGSPGYFQMDPCRVIWKNFFFEKQMVRCSGDQVRFWSSGQKRGSLGQSDKCVFDKCAG